MKHELKPCDVVRCVKAVPHVVGRRNDPIVGKEYTVSGSILHDNERWPLICTCGGTNSELAAVPPDSVQLKRRPVSADSPLVVGWYGLLRDGVTRTEEPLRDYDGVVFKFAAYVSYEYGGRYSETWKPDGTWVSDGTEDQRDIIAIIPPEAVEAEKADEGPRWKAPPHFRDAIFLGESGDLDLYFVPTHMVARRSDSGFQQVDIDFEIEDGGWKIEAIRRAKARGLIADDKPADKSEPCECEGAVGEVKIAVPHEPPKPVWYDRMRHQCKHPRWSKLSRDKKLFWVRMAQGIESYYAPEILDRTKRKEDLERIAALERANVNLSKDLAEANVKRKEAEKEAARYKESYDHCFADYRLRGELVDELKAEIGKNEATIESQNKGMERRFTRIAELEAEVERLENFSNGVLEKLNKLADRSVDTSATIDRLTRERNEALADVERIKELEAEVERLKGRERQWSGGYDMWKVENERLRNKLAIVERALRDVGMAVGEVGT